MGGVVDEPVPNKLIVSSLACRVPFEVRLGIEPEGRTYHRDMRQSVKKKAR